VHYEINYKNDEKNGITKAYFDNGKVKLIETYENGKLVSKTEYDRKGKLISGKAYSEE